MDIMSFHALGTFLVSSVVLLVIPGPTVMMVVGHALSYGRRANVLLVAAVVSGHSTALALSTLGLGALIAASAHWCTYIRLIGGTYILCLGIGFLHSGFSSGETVEPARAGSLKNLFTSTYIVTALNPNSILFFIAFVPQFVNPKGHVALQMWLLAACFLTLSTLNAMMYSFFASTAHRVLSSSTIRRYLYITQGSFMSAAGFWALLAWFPF